MSRSPCPSSRQASARPLCIAAPHACSVLVQATCLRACWSWQAPSAAVRSCATRLLCPGAGHPAGVPAGPGKHTQPLCIAAPHACSVLVQATLLACLLVLASTLGRDACGLASRLSTSFCPPSEQQRHQQGQQQGQQQQQQQQQLSAAGGLSWGSGERKGEHSPSRSSCDGPQGGNCGPGGAKAGHAASAAPGTPWHAATTLRVVMLSCVCMQLAALASLNWALGFAVAGMLVPAVAVRGAR